ncbi:hypothetical protein LZ554_005423 [Drepanopeziza brunnea f. sp. 'monogermtubi']|nr:hypothetical protein LZ554_005423 [Drepanopeziza brunnea f. sp. 'monogermtubi']
MGLDHTVGPESSESSILEPPKGDRKLRVASETPQNTESKKERKRRKRERRKARKAQEELTSSVHVNADTEPTQTNTNSNACRSAYSGRLGAKIRTAGNPESTPNVNIPSSLGSDKLPTSKITGEARPPKTTLHPVDRVIGSRRHSNANVESAKSTLQTADHQLPRYPALPVDLEDGSDVEETIITPAAASMSRRLRFAPREHLQAWPREEVTDEDQEELNGAEPDNSDGEQVFPEPMTHPGFPPAEELPKWFPENIKNIYQVDRHGGALSFKELNEITRYRAALEIILRRRWKTYLEAGEARFKLQKLVRRLRVQPVTEAYFKYRNKQYKTWKGKALASWKRLEKMHSGVLILDATININFRQERIIYEKELGGPRLIWATI